jgi:hypothetical protein
MGTKATQDKSARYLKSNFYEQLVEHAFISELLQEAWFRYGHTVEKSSGVTSSYVINSFLVIWVLMSWMGSKSLFFIIGKFLGGKQHLSQNRIAQREWC